jgi:hypothetical protein
MTLILVTIVVTAGIISAVYVWAMKSSQGGFFSAEMEINPWHPLVGEVVTFDVIVEGETPTSYHWDFGDGNTSDNRSTTHIFNRSGEYWVELIVKTPRDRDKTSGALISVQNLDIHEVLTGDRITNPSRGGLAYDLIYFDIYDGLSRPNVTGRWTGTAVCRELDIFIMTNPTNLGPRLVSEDLGRQMGDFDVTREAQVPEDGAVDCQYIMVLQVIGGMITDYTLELNVEY